ncbi:MAG: DoxX family protein [Nannocystales bacterium]
MSKKRRVAFIAVTGLFILGALPGAVMNIAQPAVLVEMSATLGVPLAMMTLVGVWKVLGIAALATPGVPRLKEWAYAGFFFDLTGAAYLHAAAGDYAGTPASLVLAGVLVTSYLLRPERAKGEEQPLAPGLNAVASAP